MDLRFFQSFITWLGALINGALIYLFNPHAGIFASRSYSNHSFVEVVINANVSEEAAYPAATAEPSLADGADTFLSALQGSGSSIMLTAVVIALLASHAYIVLRAVVRHVLERVLWRGSTEERIMEERDQEIREARVRSTSLENEGSFDDTREEAAGVVASFVASEGFWMDQGMDELTNAAKME